MGAVGARPVTQAGAAPGRRRSSAADPPGQHRALRHMAGRGRADPRGEARAVQPAHRIVGRLMTSDDDHDGRFDEIDVEYLAEWERQREQAGDEPDEDHDELWSARSELTLVRDFARARRVSPLAVLGVVLARVIAQTPPEIVLPDLIGDQASLNLFVALVGRSGQGKGGAEAAGMALLDMVDPLSPSGVGSGEGLPHLFVTGSYVSETNEETKKTFRRWVVRHHSTRALLSVPEVDTIAALSARSGATLEAELRKAYMGEPLGFQYASQEKRLPVGRHSYRLAMIVGVQPARAAPLLDNIDGGTPQRYLWLPTSDPNAPDIR